MIENKLLRTERDNFRRASIEEMLRGMLSPEARSNSQSPIFDRQLRLQGWNQKALSNSSVALIGSSISANYLAAGLLALGIGRVYLMSDSDEVPSSLEFLARLASPNIPRSEGLEHWLNCSFYKSSSCSISLLDSYSSPLLMIEKPSLIIDASEDSALKSESLEYAVNFGVPYISVSVRESESILTFYNPSKGGGESLKEAYVFSGKNSKSYNLGFQAAAAGVCSALALDIARKMLMPLDGDYLPEVPIFYHPGSVEYGDLAIEKLKGKSTYPIGPTGSTNGKKVLMVGAGALGNFAGLVLSLSGLELHIADFDSVEITNANRQILIADRDSVFMKRKKAHVLAEHLSQIAGANCLPIIGIAAHSSSELANYFEIDSDFELINADFVKSRGYDAIVGCVDNPAARAALDRIAFELSIPYFDGGTEPFSGAVRAYIPGLSPSLDAQIGISAIAERWRAAMAQRDSCTLNDKEPSVIISNMLIGSVLAGELLRFFSGKYNYKPAVYSSNARHSLVFLNGEAVMPHKKI